MIKKLVAGFAITSSLAGQPAMAYDREEFCLGFEKGYKEIKGELVFVPLCPLPTLTPTGSTPFREGMKAGIAEALTN